MNCDCCPHQPEILAGITQITDYRLLITGGRATTQGCPYAVSWPGPVIGHGQPQGLPLRRFMAGSGFRIPVSQKKSMNYLLVTKL
jgi:hypothetical protein